jgi:hypothetical protein
MGGLQDIHIEIIIHKNRTAHGGYSYGFLPDLKIVNGLCHQPMSNAMMASWAKVEWNIIQTFWTFENKFHIFESSKSEIRISNLVLFKL